MRTCVVLALFSLAAAPTLARAQREDTAATWVARNCGAVYDKIFKEVAPLRVDSGQTAISVTLGGEWTRDTTIRLLLSGNEVKGSVIQSAGKPLCDQLLDLRREQPALDIEGAARELKVMRRQISSQELPDLLRHTRRLLTKRVALRLDDTIYFPGCSIQLQVAGVKEDVSVSFSIPDPSADKAARWGSGRTSQPKLRDWVVKLLEILQLGVAS